MRRSVFSLNCALEGATCSGYTGGYVEGFGEKVVVFGWKHSPSKKM
jgi:hypothetical protein